MEITIKNLASKALVERTDNGVVFHAVGEDNIVSSSVSYEIYFRDGIVNFESIAVFLLEVIQNLGLPLEELETNRKLEISIKKIDPTKPVPGHEEEEGNE
jgi:hypothetical protein